MNNRAEHKKNIIKSLTEAQKIAFAPLSFQAINSMLEFGILKTIDESPKSFEEIQKILELSEYSVNTLLEVAEAIEIVEKKEDKFYITQLGKTFLYDEMTRVNFNFVKDVCYLGAGELKSSFEKSSPEGIKKLFPEAKTIYPYLSRLPEVIKKSWYEFDHFYSDNCFNIIYKIIENSEKIFDIGGNTGRFERICLKNNPKIDITMIDLKENIEVIKNDKELAGCKFHSADILDEKSKLPKMSGAILMSQFLDCFSKEQIEFILKRLVKTSSDDIKIYILEPFIDRQRFVGAKYSLVHTSLYFTAMANGCSKMYSYSDMEKIIKKSGLRINYIYDNLGAFDYTLLECVKNA